MLGKHHSEATKRKMSEMQKRIRRENPRRPSKATRRKMSASGKRVWGTEAGRAHCRAAANKRWEKERAKRGTNDAQH
jgi:hypothetical protein